MKKLFYSHSSSLGFTLLEAIVSSAIFALVITSVLGIYVSILKLDGRSRAQRVVAQNAQYITDFISKEVHNGHIEYSAYPLVGGFIDFSPGLYIRNQAQELELIHCDPVSVNPVPCVLNLTKNGVTAPLIGSDVQMTDFRMGIYPSADPYTPAMIYDIQPHVLLIVELTSTFGNSPEEKSKIRLQTTIAERYYPSRQ